MLGKESIISKILPRLPLPGPFPIDLPLLLKIGKKVFGRLYNEVEQLIKK